MSGTGFHFLVFGFFAFGLGACIASFLNVCIWRLPRNESVVRPASHCPRCNAPIRWHQNVPIVSWLALRGRCAHCGQPISWRYVAVELLGGVLFLAAYLQWAYPFFFAAPPPAALTPFGSLLHVPACWLVFSGLILGAFIDLDHYYLPDRVTLGGMILGVPASYFVPELQFTPGIAVPRSGLEAVGWSLGGLAFGFFFLWGLRAVASKAFRKEALGFGDVKLLGAIGAFFGPVAALFTVVLSSIVGSIVGIALVLRGRTKLGSGMAVPYGPFLALGALAWVFWGPWLVWLYLQLGTRE